jgi:hypothetical protein
LKKVRLLLLAAFCLSLSILPVNTVSGSFSDTPQQYALIVNHKNIDLGDLPKNIYKDNNCMMIPLSKTAEALGYTVTWLPDERGIRIEDSIQSAIVHEGSSDVSWIGKLRVIDLTRESNLESDVVILNGYTYISAQFFESFFNEVTVDDGIVSISPVVYSIE